jgi:hypothetical protein
MRTAGQAVLRKPLHCMVSRAVLCTEWTVAQSTFLSLVVAVCYVPVFSLACYAADSVRATFLQHVFSRQHLMSQLFLGSAQAAPGDQSAVHQLP